VKTLLVDLPLTYFRCSLQVMAIWVANGYQYPTFDFVHCSTLIRGLCSQERDSGDLTDQTQVRIHEVLMQLQFQSLKSVLVDHCHEAYGLVVRAKCGWSIVYSGDTRPCSRLVQAGACCTLLIHEATFEDVLADHATRKQHSTVSEALDIGFRMAAEYVILTHFSQRYPQVKPFHQIHRSLFLLFLHLLIHIELWTLNPSFHIMYYCLSFV
jgi:ribonuclease Z